MLLFSILIVGLGYLGVKRLIDQRRRLSHQLHFLVPFWFSIVEKKFFSVFAIHFFPKFNIPLLQLYHLLNLRQGNHTYEYAILPKESGKVYNFSFDRFLPMRTAKTTRERNQLTCAFIVSACVRKEVRFSHTPPLSFFKFVTIATF